MAKIANIDQYILETMIRLSSINDVDVLLETLLTEARRIVNADAGSIYVYDEGTLRIKYSQNDTLQRRLRHGEKMPYVNFCFKPDESSIAGYAVVKGDTINIPDVHAIPPECTYSFNVSSDNITGYVTESMLTMPLRIKNGKILGVLQIINAQDADGNIVPFDCQAEFYMRSFAANAAAALEQAYTLDMFIKSMLRMVASRDPRETFSHGVRVSRFSVEIFDRYIADHPDTDLGGYRNYRDSLSVAAKCHDFGKVGISDILLKRTFPRFDEDDRSVMKGHTGIGAMYFDGLEQEVFRMAQEIALRHHERWDGGAAGYPGDFDFRGFPPEGRVTNFVPLRGEEIPLSARIVSVADVFDALSHARCYKPAWTIEDAFIEIQNEAGKQFDPYVVASFLLIKERIAQINAELSADA